MQECRLEPASFPTSQVMGSLQRNEGRVTEIKTTKAGLKPLRGSPLPTDSAGGARGGSYKRGPPSPHRARTPPWDFPRRRRRRAAFSAPRAPATFPLLSRASGPAPRSDQNTCRVPPCPITPRPGSDHAAPRGAHWPAGHGPGANWLTAAGPAPTGARCILVRLRAPPRRPLPPQPPRPSRAARAAPGQSRAGGRGACRPQKLRVAATAAHRARAAAAAPSLRPAAALLLPAARHDAHAGLRGPRRRARSE